MGQLGQTIAQARPGTVLPPLRDQAQFVILRILDPARDTLARGAGRPEANYALERAVEEAARLLKMDPVRLRKKNLIPASKMPFKTPINTYDSGDYKDAPVKKK